MRGLQVSLLWSCCLSRVRPSFGFVSSHASVCSFGVETRRLCARREIKPVLSNMAKDKPTSPALKRQKSTTTVVTPSPKKQKTSKKASNSQKAAPSTPSRPAILTSSQVAAVASEQPYLDLHVAPAELRPSATLTTGQCFHWRVVVETDDDAVAMDESTTTTASAWGTHDSTEWIGILRISDTRQTEGQSMVVSLKETPETTLYRVLHAPPSIINVKQVLQDYFQLNTPLEPLYQEWSESDPTRLSRIAKCIPGVRILEQDPWETLVSFICSSNNNIPRITKMLRAIRETYGEPLVRIGDETFYSFPSLNTLREGATEQDLRDVGLGYRAKYLVQTMETLHELGGEAYLHSLREIKDPDVVQEALMQFCGVGRKVADCVALFSLRQGNAVPIDVHVWNIARRDYDADGVLAEVKSMTPTVYKQVAGLFQSRFVSYAGWAHSLLFVAELPSFRPVLPQDVIDEMDKFREVEQEKKVAAREAKKANKGAGK